MPRGSREYIKEVINKYLLAADFTNLLSYDSCITIAT